MRSVLFITATLLIINVGCTNIGTNIDTTPTPLPMPTPIVFEVYESDIAINNEAQNVEIVVVCNQEIAVEVAVEWIELVEIQHPEDYVVILRVAENVKREERVAKVSLIVGEEVKTVTIKQQGVPEIMQVAIGHYDKLLESPQWEGTLVQGSIDWGDDMVESYTEGITHYYMNDEHHTAIFTMSGATSFTIDKIGNMDSLTIAVN